MELPQNAKLLDVDGIPVAVRPDGSCVAYALKTGTQRPYPHRAKVAEGDPLTPDEFRSWIITGRNRFDV